MIIKGIFELVYTLLSVVLAPFSLPALPDGIQSIFDEIVGYLTGAVGLLCVFVRPTTLQLLIPAVIIVINAEHIWNGILWILKKLPFVGIE